MASVDKPIDMGGSSEQLRMLEGMEREEVQSGSRCSEWLRCLMRERDSYIVTPAGTNLNYITMAVDADAEPNTAKL
eukprot:COSAG02_NODE_7618_length_2931_cov_186.388449_3_plen_76_part_00